MQQNQAMALNPSVEKQATACEPRVGDWIATFTGRQAYPMDLRPSEITIEDIAHSLSMQCRYTGHCLRFYSVAEHSVLMARWVLAEGMDSSVALAALLHDATEAYLTDIPRPVKPFLLGYKDAEATAWAAIAERFGLFNVPPAVHDADARILVDERAQNMAPSAVEWDNMPARGLGVTLQFWSPEQAEAAFLQMYWQLIETGRM